MIEVKDLTKYYGEFCAVKGISFKINDGEITGLLGPNGAGKTTTMRMITGYFLPSAGEVTVNGTNIEDQPLDVKKMIGYLPESAPLYQDMLVYDYLAYAAEAHRIPDAEKRIRETAEQCGLIDVMHKNIGELSKGYRQRVGLAHAMIHDPKILILDEPTSGLDPNQIIEIRELIREIGKKKTVILSTHILPEVEATCDRVIIINKGTIVADSRTSELRNVTGDKMSVKITLAGVAFEDVQSALKSVKGVTGVSKTDHKENQTTVLASVSEDIRPALFELIKQKGWTLYELSLEQSSLESVFRELTVGGENA
jgi:ABC-2 type transport system ATP-binding protein